MAKPTYTRKGKPKPKPKARKPQKARTKMDEQNEREQQRNEEAKRLEEDRKARGAGSGEDAVRKRSRPTGGGNEPPGIHGTGDTEEDSGTGQTGDAEEGENEEQGDEEEEEEQELPKEMFPRDKSAEDYAQENYDPKSEFPPGDATKGMPNYDEIALGKQQFIAFRDYRAYLVSQAVKNERANDEFQARAVKAMKRQAKAIGVLLNPDFQRDTSIDYVEAQSMSAEQWTTYLENFKKQREKEQKDRGVAGSGGNERHQASAAD
jgi:hypothetical protein